MKLLCWLLAMLMSSEGAKAEAAVGLIAGERRRSNLERRDPFSIRHLPTSIKTAPF